MEQLEEGFYQPQNLNQKDANAIKTQTQNALVALNRCLGAITSMQQNLKNYQSCLIDFVNLEAEIVDMQTKYTTNTNPTNGFLLPGVVTTPDPVDIQSIKADSEKMTQLKDLKDRTDTQKIQALAVSKEALRQFLASWKSLAYIDVMLDQTFDGINTSIQSKM